MNKNIAEKILEYAAAGLESAASERSNIDDYLDFSLPDPDLRRSVSSILFEYFRHKSIIDKLLNSLISRPCNPELRHVLCAATTQMLYQSGIAAASAANVAVVVAKKRFGQHIGGFVNAILRNVARTNFQDFCDKLSAEESSNLPPAIYRHWQKIYPEQLGSLVELLKHRAALTFRACGAPLNDEEILSVEAVAVPSVGFHFYKTESPALLFKSELLKDGRIYVQDPAAALAPTLASPQPNEAVIDLCAAPGGKTLMLAELLGDSGCLVVADRSEVRQKITEQNLRLRGYQHPVVIGSVQDNPFKEQKFDVVLLDVPCSNTGVFHRRPDALWSFSNKKLNELVKLQMELLKAAAKIINPDGRLVYSTCSIEPAENQSLIALFIRNYPEFQLQTETQLMPCTGNDGAYVAVLKFHKS